MLRINLDEAERVFLTCATCGLELFDWGREQTDGLYKFWAGAIQEAAMRKAIDCAKSYIEDRLSPARVGMQNPGSLPDWPIEEQHKLFHLIGDAESSINVKLSEGFMMIPVYSISGIAFPAEISFMNCLLCRRKKCPQRRAAFNENLYRNRYGLQEADIQATA